MQFTVEAMQDNTRRVLMDCYKVGIAMANAEKWIMHTGQGMEYYKQRARKMHYTNTKGVGKSIFRKWQQKAKARLSRYNTDNPMAPQLEWNEWGIAAQTYGGTHRSECWKLH